MAMTKLFHAQITVEGDFPGDAFYDAHADEFEIMELLIKDTLESLEPRLQELLQKIGINSRITIE